MRVISVRVDATNAVTGVDTLGASWASSEPATCPYSQSFMVIHGILIRFPRRVPAAVLLAYRAFGCVLADLVPAGTHQANIDVQAMGLTSTKQV